MSAPLTSILTRPDYEPQQHFTIGFDGCGTQLRHAETICALQWAIEIARRLCLSDRGLQVTVAHLSSPASSPVRIDSLPLPVVDPAGPPDTPLMADNALTIADLVRLVLSKSSFTVVLGEFECWGCVYPDKPRVINVRRSFVEETGTLLEVFGADEIEARRHLLFLSVIICHQLQHSIRRQLSNLGVAFDTPARVRSTDDRLRPAVKDKTIHGDGESGFHGECGWYWEEHVLGGFLALWTKEEDDTRLEVQGQAKAILITQAGRQGQKTPCHLLEDDLVRRLTDPLPRVRPDALLPLFDEAAVFDTAIASSELRCRTSDFGIDMQTWWAEQKHLLAKGMSKARIRHNQTVGCGLQYNLPEPAL